jgi:hypothetical protein
MIGKYKSKSKVLDDIGETRPLEQGPPNLTNKGTIMMMCQERESGQLKT